MNPSSFPAISSAERTRLLGLLLLLAALAAYANSFAGAFVFDDVPFIVDAARHGRLDDWRGLAASNRPIINLSLGLNYALGDLNVVGYHLFNFAVHAAAGLVLFGLVRRTALRWATPGASLSDGAGVNPGEPAKGTPASSAEPWATYLAFAAALLWLVHPLQTQAVTYIIQRAESLTALFYLLMLYALVRSVEVPRSGPQRFWQVIAAAACVLGMATKPVMATAPVVAFLFDAVFLSTPGAASWRRRWALYLALAASWLVLLWTIGFGREALRPEGQAGFGLKDVRPMTYALAQPGVLLHYLRLTFWPAGLCIDYFWLPTESARWAIPVVAAFVLLSLVGLLRRRWWGFVGAAFFLILAPTSSFMPLLDLAVEHRMYLPLAAVAVLAAAGLTWMARRMGGGAIKALTPALSQVAASGAGGGRGGSAAGVLTAALAGALAVPLIVASLARNHAYGDEEILWGEAVALRPGNPRAQANYAWALRQRGELGLAMRHWNSALAALPLPKVRASRGMGYLMMYQQAQEAQRQALRVFRCFPRSRISPSQPPPAFLGAALKDLRDAADLAPRDAEIHGSLGAALRAAGGGDEALRQFRLEAELDPASAPAQHDLGVELTRHGLYDQALEHLEEAVRLDPTLAAAQNDLGAEYARRGQAERTQYVRALEHFEEAVRLDPALADAQRNLAKVYLTLHQPGEAVAHLAQAIIDDPLNAEAHFNLGLQLAREGDILTAAERFYSAQLLGPDNPQYRQALSHALDDLDQIVRDRAAAFRFTDALVLVRGALRMAHDANLCDREAGYREKIREYEAWTATRPSR